MIAAAAAAVSYTSCVDLDETLYSAVSSENYYNTRMDVVRAVFRPFEHGYYSIQSRQVIEELSADLVATWQKDDWWYDGVMYSFDAGYVNGLGNGSFGPKYRLPLYELAALLYRINPIEDVEGIDLPFMAKWNDSTYEGETMGKDALQKAMKAAVAAGYLSWKDGNTEDFDPTATVSRQEAIADILKACAQGKNVNLNLSSVNTAVLDRFTDVSGLSTEQEQYLAYAVSHGMVNGTSSTTLSPDAGITRAEAGVLVYRTLLGLDETKNQDYRENVQYVLGGD